MIYVGADKGSVKYDDQEIVDTIVRVLNSCGKQAEAANPAVIPDQEGFRNNTLGTGHEGDIIVFCVNGGQAGWTYGSFVQDYQPGFAKTIFAGQGWIKNDAMTEENFINAPSVKEHDAQNDAVDKSIYLGKSLKQISEENPNIIGYCWGETPEDIGQRLCDGRCESGGASSTTVGGGGVYYPDKTFYGLIRQICGAVDAVFIIANNMAYLISFKDFYEYRNRYEEFIPEIPAKNILTDGFEHGWANAGFYNTVVVDYGTAVDEWYGREIDLTEKDIKTKIGKTIKRTPTGGRIQYEYTPLVKQYGQQPYYYELPEEDEEGAKALADALLAAHVRDYSLDIKLTCLFDSKITVGSWVKIPKKISKMSYERSGKNYEEIRYKSESELSGETKRKQLKETGSDELDLDYDLFFVQGRYIKWGQNDSLLMDIHLKFGPDTPEDPINATVGGEMVASTNGNFGNDCFTIADICVSNNDYLTGEYSGGALVQQIKSMVNGEHQPDSEDMQPRAAQGSNYAQKYSGMSAPEVYSNFRSEYKYSYYADNSSCWSCASDFYDNAGKTANCGDTTCLLKVFYDCIGIPSAGVHVHGHYFNCIQLNGTWEIIDGVRIDNQTCGFPDGTGYVFSQPYPCNSYKGNQNNTE